MTKESGVWIDEPEAVEREVQCMNQWNFATGDVVSGIAAKIGGEVLQEIAACIDQDGRVGCDIYVTPPTGHLCLFGDIYVNFDLEKMLLSGVVAVYDPEDQQAVLNFASFLHRIADKVAASAASDAAD